MIHRSHTFTAPRYTALRTALALLSLVAATSAFAQQSGGPSPSLSLGLGTPGANAQLGFALSPSVGLRLGVNGYNRNYNTTSGQVLYDGKLKLQSLEVLGDWYPMGGGFRLTAGLVANSNKFDLTGRPSSGSYTFNGRTYSAAQAGTVVANVDFRSTAPYLGLGFGGETSGRGLYFTGDVGALFQGSPQVRLTATGAAANPALGSDLAAEEARLRDDLNNFKIYPVVRVGIGYRF